MRVITKESFRSLSIISGLIASLNFAHGQMLIQPASADSVVQVVADSQGLQLIPSDQIPAFGTFWVVSGTQSIVPWPIFPPLNDPATTPVYSLGADGQFLVDTTGGVVPQPSARQASSGINSSMLVQAQVDAVANLIGQVQANQQMQAMAGNMMAMDVPMPGDGGGDGTNFYTPDYSSYTVDYGSNLWVAGISVLSGNLNGTATNTQNGVMYDIQSRTNLTQTDWQYEGTILGSGVTNWTPLSVSQNGRSSLFLRLRSNAGDGSGLPSWWEQQYGLSGVNPNALDLTGDGWTFWQDYVAGYSPLIFRTPPAPQGVTVLNNMAANQATIQWQTSPGPVTGYTVEKTVANLGTTTTVQDFSVGTTHYQDDISGDSPGQYDGNNYQVSYRVQAHYSSGGSSAWSVSVPLQRGILSGSIVPGTNGATYLLVSGLPKTAAAVRLVYFDYYAVQYYNDFSFNTYRDIPVSAFTNGAALLSASWQWSGVDAYGYTNTADQIQSIDSNGNASAASWLYFIEWNQPFYDGRVQMKQNLIFLLRAASESNPFNFEERDTNKFFASSWGWWNQEAGAEGYGYNFTFPANYAYVSPFRANGDYADGNNQYFGYYADEPFDDNYRYRNFVFNAADIDEGNGFPTTGAYFIPMGLMNPAYEFVSTRTNAWLATNQTRWLFSEWENDNYWGSDTSITTADYITYSIAPNARNLFGLPYLSALFFYYNDTGLATATLYAGSPLTLVNPYTYYYPTIYVETAQPQFQTAEYDFWQPAYSAAYVMPGQDLIPGMNGFSPTNKSRVMIVPIGGETQIAGYAKLAVTNGYPGVYAYLGQYFDRAYQIDTNGNATTKPTGVLSPKGQFFATQPGPAALVTMPDVDTGARGTCTVYSVSLVLDKNHDGFMDLSFNGPDNTSASSPYIHWCNNNYDRWKYDLLGLTNEQDDVLVGSNPGTSTAEPDCDYTNAAGYRAIPCPRDLEDYARLWVCGVTTNLLAALPPGSTVTLSWGDVGSPNSSNPTIDLFAAADADGGIGYQTNEVVADEQTNLTQCPYIGRLAPGGSIQLNAIQFANNWAGNHFIWCGVNYGSGGLNMTIADGNGNTLAQTTAYIQIVDIKQMYERWTVGDRPNFAPTNTAYLATEGLPVGASAFQYTPPQDTNTPYILFVHGWNMEVWEKDRFAEATFKRLYWQGYQGRFGSFRWPTYFDFPLGSWSWQAVSLRNFDNSESNSWASGAGLLNKLNDLNAEYPGKVYLIAHSMGNVAAGEALRLAGSSKVVNTYAALQGAVSAHAYDATTPTRDLSASTPDDYANYWTNGAPYFNSSAGAATYVNFFNTNDWALTFLWPEDQNLKPDNGGFSYPGYFYSVSGLHPNGFYVQYGSGTNAFRNLNFPGDTYPIFSFCDEARSQALGAQLNVGGAFKAGVTYQQIELDALPYGFSGNHVDHSGEFRSDNARRSSFWNAVLVQMNLK